MDETLVFVFAHFAYATFFARANFCSSAPSWVHYYGTAIVNLCGSFGCKCHYYDERTIGIEGVVFNSSTILSRSGKKY